MNVLDAQIAFFESRYDKMMKITLLYLLLGKTTEVSLAKAWVNVTQQALDI